MSDSAERARSKYYSTHFKHFQKEAMDDSTFHYYVNKLGTTFPREKNAVILEVGCGLGKFLAVLERLGYTSIRGVDPSREMVQIAQRNTRVPVVCAPDVPAYLSTLQDHSIDQVYLLDVIEHVEKHKVVALLAGLHAKLKPGGAIVATTENMASPIGRLQRYLDFTHEYNYTEITLRQVLELGGFHSVDISGSNDRPSLNPKQLTLWVARRTWFRVLDMLNRIERPGSLQPKILGKDLIARAVA